MKLTPIPTIWVYLGASGLRASISTLHKFYNTFGNQMIFIVNPSNHKKGIAEKDLSSKEFPGQFLPAYLREIAENIIA
jgi:hypothetical protein